MIREIKPKVPFEVTCDDCKQVVKVMAHNEETALPEGWRVHYEHVEGNHGRGYHTHKSHLCPTCRIKPRWAVSPVG
jgi:hypothetical protein